MVKFSPFHPIGTQLLVLLTFLFNFLSAWYVELPANSAECFYADLKQYDLLLLSYDVVGEGELAIDFKLLNPFGVVLQDTPGRKDAYYSYNATHPGLHKYCFTNPTATKQLSFNPSISSYQSDKKQTADDFKIVEEIEKMATLINKIESQFHASLERNHLHSTVSARFDSKLQYWTYFQALVVLGVCYWQVRHLKSFFEVRRFV